MKHIQYTKTTPIPGVRELQTNHIQNLLLDRIHVVLGPFSHSHTTIFLQYYRKILTKTILLNIYLTMAYLIQRKAKQLLQDCGYSPFWLLHVTPPPPPPEQVFERLGALQAYNLNTHSESCSIQNCSTLPE